MLQTIQIFTLLQGVFLLFFLFKNRSKYHYYNFNFLSALLIALLLYIIGDNNSKLFVTDYDFFFNKALFITLLYIFLKYFNATDKLRKSIILYFIPIAVYIAIELYERAFSETPFIENLEVILDIIFISYLLVSLLLLRKIKIALFIKLPFYLLLYSLLITYALSFIDFSFNQESLITLNTVLIFEIAMLFYYLTYVFVFNHNFFDLPILHSKYKNSSLNSKDVEEFKFRIIRAMTEDKIFTNPDLSLQLLSDAVAIPKHYISEILSSHLHTNFQDFVNEYRIEEFIKLYSNPENDHFSVFGIATSVGFKSKAAFNANFKKIKGISPTEYKHKNS